MSQPRRHTPARYQLRVDGHLDTRWSARFDDLALRLEDAGTTTLTGLIQDQSQLHGLLAKIRDLGLTLISIRVLGETWINENAPSGPITASLDHGSAVAGPPPPRGRHHGLTKNNQEC